MVIDAIGSEFRVVTVLISLTNKYLSVPSKVKKLLKKLLKKLH